MFCFLKTGSHSIVHTSLKLIKRARLTLNLQKSPHLSFLIGGITGESLCAQLWTSFCMCGVCTCCTGVCMCVDQTLTVGVSLACFLSYFYICVHVCMYVCHGARLEDSLWEFVLCYHMVLELGHQPWWQAPLSTESLSCWASILFVELGLSLNLKLFNLSRLASQ